MLFGRFHVEHRMLQALRKKIDDQNVLRIYWATFGLGVAYGMAISVIAVFLAGRGYRETDIGSLAAWFAAGIMAAAVPSGILVARLSAKVVLTLALVTYALTVTLFPFAPSYAAIAVLRFFDGVASVCVWVASETILLARARREIKAFVTSLYAMSIAIGYITGPLLAYLAAPIIPIEGTFWIAGGLAVVTAMYVALRLERGSDAHREPGHDANVDVVSDAAAAVERAPLGTLINRIKASCFATFAYGYFQASVVLFLPLFLVAQKGVSEDATRLIPAFFAGGMLLFTNYAGRLGDRHGHLLIMRLLAIVGASMIAGFVWLGSFTEMCGAVFVAGATLASISPLSLALQGLVTREYSRATGVYNAFYAAGMLLGPPISSQIYHRLGGGPMLYHLAALWVAFIVFAQVFRRDDPAVAREPQASIAVS